MVRYPILSILLDIQIPSLIHDESDLGSLSMTVVEFVTVEWEVAGIPCIGQIDRKIEQ